MEEQCFLEEIATLCSTLLDEKPKDFIQDNLDEDLEKIIEEISNAVNNLASGESISCCG